ncbi:TetR/AcrR family transcriptional regulator [Rathayibacter sp. VKM Ac-2760]|uniref:TetR/AcrR family transcriptional regulator n=1 Tax=Rathayibacter sp. VKM Ac-2760 TaxID=2609253 RepID=UPI00131632CC|nr:TetR/AcrR family transcriptional regulator [Rathayibacter sp. VKM Ac-2760]QHC61068.1 TetR family transcriptional regulator [Rathayibacter sp. VKM Ac-2760]
MRTRILDACLAQFGERGFHGTTMKDVAARADISLTGLLHHFPTKAGLLDAVLRRRYDDSADVVTSAPRRDVFAAQARVLRENTGRPGIIQLHTIISAEASSAGHPAHEFFAQRLDDFREYLTGAFQDAQDEGRLKVDADPAQLANLYIAVLDGLQLQWSYNPAAVDIEQGVRTFLCSLLLGNLD